MSEKAPSDDAPLPNQDGLPGIVHGHTGWPHRGPSDLTVRMLSGKTMQYEGLGPGCSLCELKLRVSQDMKLNLWPREFHLLKGTRVLDGPGEVPLHKMDVQDKDVLTVVVHE